MSGPLWAMEQQSQRNQEMASQIGQDEGGAVAMGAGWLHRNISKL